MTYRLSIGSILAPAPPRAEPGPEITPGPSRLDLVDAALRCLARSGVVGTSLEDVAREAGCSRATVYRSFPGGKEALLAAVVEVEVGRFFAFLDARMARAPDLEELLVQAVLGAGTALSCHPALSYLLANEPDVLLPRVSFSELDVLLSAASDFAVGRLTGFMGEQPARRAGEWVARVVLSYLSCPSEEVDLLDERSVRRLVSAFVLPAVRAVSDSYAHSTKEGKQWPAPRR